MVESGPQGSGMCRRRSSRDSPGFSYGCQWGCPESRRGPLLCETDNARPRSVFLYVRNAGKGSKVEDLPGGEVEDDVEDDDHGAVGNRCCTHYLACQLSVFGTNDTLHSAFGMTVMSS